MAASIERQQQELQEQEQLEREQLEREQLEQERWREQRGPRWKERAKQSEDLAAPRYAAWRAPRPIKVQIADDRRRKAEIHFTNKTQYIRIMLGLELRDPTTLPSTPLAAGRPRCRQCEGCKAASCHQCPDCRAKKACPSRAHRCERWTPRSGSPTPRYLTRSEAGSAAENPTRESILEALTAMDDALADLCERALALQELTEADPLFDWAAIGWEHLTPEVLAAWCECHRDEADLLKVTAAQRLSEVELIDFGDPIYDEGSGLNQNHPDISGMMLQGDNPNSQRHFDFPSIASEPGLEAADFATSSTSGRRGSQPDHQPTTGRPRPTIGGVTALDPLRESNEELTSTRIVDPRDQGAVQRTNLRAGGDLLNQMARQQEADVAAAAEREQDEQARRIELDRAAAARREQDQHIHAAALEREQEEQARRMELDRAAAARREQEEQARKRELDRAAAARREQEELARRVQLDRAAALARREQEEQARRRELDRAAAARREQEEQARRVQLDRAAAARRDREQQLEQEQLARRVELDRAAAVARRDREHRLEQDRVAAEQEQLRRRAEQDQMAVAARRQELLARMEEQLEREQGDRILAAAARSELSDAPRPVFTEMQGVRNQQQQLGAEHQRLWDRVQQVEEQADDLRRGHGGHGPPGGPPGPPSGAPSTSAGPATPPPRSLIEMLGLRARKATSRGG
jgi:hypothetical protein